jgi:hypothetical protein
MSQRESNGALVTSMEDGVRIAGFTIVGELSEKRTDAKRNTVGTMKVLELDTREGCTMLGESKSYPPTSPHQGKLLVRL